MHIIINSTFRLIIRHRKLCILDSAFLKWPLKPHLFNLLHFARGVAEAKCILVTHVCVSVSMSVPRRIPTLLHGPGCNLGNGRGSTCCALLDGFAIGAHFSLLSQHSAEREMSVSACTCCMPGLVYWQVYWSTYKALDPVLVWSVYPDNNLWTKLPLT